MNKKKKKKWFMNKVVGEQNWLGSHVMSANTIDICIQIKIR